MNDNSQSRTRWLKIRVSDDELAALDAAAERDGQGAERSQSRSGGTSTWLRELGMRSASKGSKRP